MPTGGQERVSYLRIDYKMREKKGAYVRISKKRKKTKGSIFIELFMTDRSIYLI